MEMPFVLGVLALTLSLISIAVLSVKNSAPAPAIARVSDETERGESPTPRR
jgi:hypothetical protein